MASPEVDISRCEVGDALVVAQMIVVTDEVADLLLEIAGQIVVLEQDAVLERLVPAFDLALGLGIERCTADVIHAMVFEPVCQIAGNVTRPIVAEQPRPLNDTLAVETRSLKSHGQGVCQVAGLHGRAQLPGDLTGIF